MNPDTTTSCQKSAEENDQKDINEDISKLSMLVTAVKSPILISDQSMVECNVRGKFGWTQIADVDIPYIFRIDGKYCSVRIVESQVLKKYEFLLHKDIYSCAKIKCWQMNGSESKLFNEINFCHCDGLYGNRHFTESDILIKLEDAQQFYTFLSTCFQKLIHVNGTKITKCGFIKVNKEAIVPFTLVSEVVHVPLFYFEGEIEDVKPYAVKISGWDLAYLKFCCKTQGIRTALYDHDSCDVVSIEIIKRHFPAETTFEEYWPNEIVNELLLSKNVANYLGQFNAAQFNQSKNMSYFYPQQLRNGYGIMQTVNLDQTANPRAPSCLISKDQVQKLYADLNNKIY